jgi:hypothetical protein
MSSEWKATAQQNQQYFANRLGDRTWDKFSMPSDGEEFSKKIAFALFGLPRDETNPKTLGYTLDEWQKVTEIKQKCIEYCQMQEGYDKSVCVAFIFVCAYHSELGSTMTPLVRVKNTSVTDIQNSYFIDPCGEGYYTWKDYLDENIFDGWWICVPFGAVYSNNEDVQVEFHDQSSRALRRQDETTKIAFRRTEHVMSYFKDTNSFDWAVTAIRAAVRAPGAAYGAGQNFCELVDHGNHDQSISRLDFEERAISASRKSIIKSLDTFSKKDDATRLDVLHLTAIVFFFTHSELSFKAASTLIKDVQDKKLSEKRQSLEPEEQKVFDNMLKGHQEMVIPGMICEIQGNNEFIRELNRIDIQELLAHFSLGPGTQLSINQNLDIDAKAYFQMTPDQRDQILKQSQDLKNGRITHTEFEKNVGVISKEYRIRFEHQRQEARKYIQEAFHVEDVSEIVVAGKRIFENLQPHELDRLHQVCKQAGKNYNPDCIKVAKEMADTLKCKNIIEFAAVMEYFIRKLDGRVAELRYNNPKPIMPPGLKAREYYFDSVVQEFLSDELQKTAMVDEFNQLREECDAANSSGSPKFKNASAAANHYDKHCFLPCVDPDKNLSPERYFEIAREMTAEKNLDDEKPTWTQDGNSLFYTFNSVEYGATAVRFDNISNGISVIATLMKKDIPIGKPRLYNN